MITPLTKQRIKDHFTYSWWKYALLLVISWMSWSIIYSTTAYRPPEEKKVVLGLYGSGTEVNLDDYMLAVQQIHMPDMEELSCQDILPDMAYGEMVLTTRLVSQECDIYILPTEQFQSLASQGGLQPLDMVVSELEKELEAAGINLNRGRRVNNSGEDREKHLYGIPCRDLPGAQHLLWCDTSDLYICVYHVTNNDANVLKFLSIMVHDMLNDPPTTPTDLNPAPRATSVPASPTGEIVVGLYGTGTNTALVDYMQQVNRQQMPEMAIMSALDILTTRMNARDCSLYLLPRAQFLTFAAQDSFQPLDEVAPELVAEMKAAGVKLDAGMVLNSEGSGQTQLFGIPCQELPGAQALMQFDTSDLYLCMFRSNSNDDAVLRFLSIFVRDMLTAPAPGSTTAQ